jgi:hypothetical protein
MIQNVLDFMAWKHIDKKWLEFDDVQNIRLGLALHKVNL